MQRKPRKVSDSSMKYSSVRTIGQVPVSHFVHSDKLPPLSTEIPSDSIWMVEL